MELSLDYTQAHLPDNETAKALASPHIRLLQVQAVTGVANSSASVLDEVPGFASNWTAAPQAAATGSLLQFSTVCWLTGRKIAESLAVGGGKRAPPAVTWPTTPWAARRTRWCWRTA